MPIVLGQASEMHDISRSTARRSFRVELRGEWKRTAHSLPITEIIHSQMRVCNREVGLSLFELRRRSRLSFQGRPGSQNFVSATQLGPANQPAHQSAGSVEKIWQGMASGKVQEQREFQEAQY